MFSTASVVLAQGFVYSGSIAVRCLSVGGRASFSCASFGLPLCRTAGVNLLLLVSSCAARSRAGGDSWGDGERMSGMCSCGRQQEEGRESHPVWRHDQHGWTQLSLCHTNTEMRGKQFRHYWFLGMSQCRLCHLFCNSGTPTIFSDTSGTLFTFV